MRTQRSSERSDGAEGGARGEGARSRALLTGCGVVALCVVAGALLGAWLSRAWALAGALVGAVLGFAAGGLWIALALLGDDEAGEESEAERAAALDLPTELLGPYLAGVSRRASELKVALAALSQGDAAAQEEARWIAHKLRGSGATYGFTEITRAAALVEEAPAAELFSATRALVTVLERVSAEQANAQPKLRRDPLTGLLSEPALRQALLRLSDRGMGCVLARVDLAGLDQANARYGHLAGDHLLQQVGRALDPGDSMVLAGRRAGGSFLVAFKALELAAARARLEELLFEVGHKGGVVYRDQVRLDPGLRVAFALLEPGSCVDELLAELGAAAPDSVSTPAPAAPSAPPRPASPEAELILVVDDDPAVARLVQRVLREEGFEVEHCSSGEEALEFVAQVVPSLCLLDLHMPGMNGFELLSRLRGGALPPGVPVLMLTSADGEEETVAGFDLGADDYVVKPFKPRSLVARVRRRCRRSAP